VGACRSGCGLGEASYSQGWGATRVRETVLMFRCAGIGKGTGACAVDYSHLVRHRGESRSGDVVGSSVCNAIKVG